MLIGNFEGKLKQLIYFEIGNFENMPHPVVTVYLCDNLVMSLKLRTSGSMVQIYCFFGKFVYYYRSVKFALAN